MAPRRVALTASCLKLSQHFVCTSRWAVTLGGVHLELTGEDVTECTGGARGLTDGDLARAYKSTVDPRLNYEQAMEVAMRIAGLHRENGQDQSKRRLVACGTKLRPRLIGFNFTRLAGFEPFQ